MVKEIEEQIDKIKMRMKLLIDSIKTIKYKDVNSLCNEFEFYKQLLNTLQYAKKEIERLKTK